MKHSVKYNGMVWQVVGPRAERGDDFASRADAMRYAQELNRRDEMYGVREEYRAEHGSGAFAVSEFD